MEPLLLIVKSDPTGNIAKFRRSLLETQKPVKSLEGSLHRVNAEFKALTGNIAASAAAISSSGLSSLAGVAKNAASAMMQQARAERELATAQKERATAVGILRLAQGQLLQDEAKAQSINKKASILAETEAVKARTKAEIDLVAAQNKERRRNEKLDLTSEIAQTKAKAQADKEAQLAAIALSSAREKAIQVLEREKAATSGTIRSISASAAKEEAAAIEKKQKALQALNKTEELAATSKDRLAISSSKAAKSQIELEQSVMRLNKAREQEAARAAKKLTDSERFSQSIDKEILSLRNQIAAIELGAAGLKRYEAALLGAGSAVKTQINEWDRLKNKLQEVKQAQQDQAKKLSEEKSARDSLLSGIRQKIKGLNEEKIALEGGASALLAHKAAMLGLTKEVGPLASQLSRLQQALKESYADKAARDFQTLANANPKAAAAIRQTEVAITNAAQGAGKAGTAFRRMTESQQSFDIMKAKIAAVEAQIKTLPPSSEAARRALERLATLNIGAEKISADISKMRGEFEKATNNGGSFGEMFSSLGFRALTVVGAFLAVKAAAKQVAEEFSKAISAFSQFDDQIRIAASYTGVLDSTSETFIRLSEVAKKVGFETSISATEAAKALTLLASKGFSASQQIALMPGQVALAESAQISLTDATETTVKALKAYRLGVEDAGKVNDIISFTAQNSGASVLYLKEAFTQALLAGEGAGLTFGEVAATLAVLGDRSVHAGTASRTVRAMMISMQAPTKRMAAAYEDLGIKLRDADGTFRGYLTILGELNEKNISLIESNELFGRYFSTSALAVVDGTDKIKQMSEAYEELNGITEDTAKFQQEGLGGALRILSGSINLLYTEVGGLLAPTIIEIAKYFTEFTRSITENIKVSKTFVEVARFIARGFNLIVSVVDGLVDAITGLGGLIAKAIIAPFGAVAELLKKIGAIKENPFIDWFNSISDFTESFDGSGKRMADRSRAIERGFDGASAAVDKFAEKREKIRKIDMITESQADFAAESAVKRARAQGKSAEEAIKASTAAREEFHKQAQAAKEAEEQEGRLAVSREKNAADAKKRAEEARDITIKAGYSPDEAQAAYDSVIESAKKLKEATIEVTEETKAQAQAIEDAAENYDKYTAISGKIQEIAGKMKLAKQQVDQFGRSSALGAAALSRLTSYDIEKTNLSKEANKLKKSFADLTGDTDDASVAIDNLAGEMGGGAEMADALSDSMRDIEFNQKNIGTAGVDNLNLGLKNAAESAQNTSLSISTVNKSMNEMPSDVISFVSLDASDYEKKSEIIKNDIASFKDKNRWILRTEAPEFEPIRAEFKRLQDELTKTESLVVLTQKMGELRGELDATKDKLSETKQVFADGKLTIDVDPQVSAELEKQAGLIGEQISLLAQQKFVAESIAGEFEIVNGVVTSISPAAQALNAAYDSLRDTSGKIKTEWKEIDGVWKEVIPSGEVLIDFVNRKMMEGVAASGQYGTATAEMFNGLRTGSEGVDRILDDLQKSIEFTASKSGDLKFNELADSMTAASALKREIDGLGALISEVGQDSEIGRAALKRMLTAQAQEQSVNKQISDLKKEIFETAGEADKAATEIRKLGQEVRQATENFNKLGTLEGFAGIVSNVKAGAASVSREIVTGLTKAMAVSKALSDQTGSLRKYIDAVGISSSKGQAALAKLITAEGLESEAKKKVLELENQVKSLAAVTESTAELKLLSAAEGTRSIISEISREASAVSGSISDSSVSKLAAAMSAAEALKNQVDSLRQYVDSVGASSNEGREALKKLLEAEGASDIAQKKLEAIRNEIKGLSSDAEEAVNSINEFGKINTGEFLFTAGKSIEEMTNSELNKYIEAQRKIGDALTTQADRSPGMMFSADSRSLSERDKVESDYYKGYVDAEMERLKRVTNNFVDDVEESFRPIKRVSARGGAAVVVSAGDTGPARRGGIFTPAAVQQATVGGQPSQVINNTYNSYAVPENANTRKQRERAEAQR